MVWYFFSRHCFTLASSLYVMKMNPLLFFDLGSMGSSMVSIWKEKVINNTNVWPSIFSRYYWSTIDHKTYILWHWKSRRLLLCSSCSSFMFSMFPFSQFVQNLPLQRHQNIPWLLPQLPQDSNPQQRSSWQLCEHLGGWSPKIQESHTEIIYCEVVPREKTNKQKKQIIETEILHVTFLTEFVILFNIPLWKLLV